MANNFPNILPSFNADFVNGIYVDPRITFTRAGTRTYYGQEVVKAEENLVLQSQTFDVSWSVSGLTVTANTTVAPDGTTTADTVTYTGASNYLFQSRNVTPSTDYTFTFYALAGTATEAKYRVYNNTAATDIVAETSYFADINAVTWTRITVSFTTPAGCTSIFVYPIRNSGTADTIFLWGAQLEQRSFATAYTATTTQTITRYQRQLKTAAANEWPREFNPVTGECLGRSVWESRTNLLLRSEELDNAYWTKTNATVSANQVIAPDGTLTADKVVENTATGLHGAARLGITLSGTNSWSCFAKAAERTRLTIDAYDGASNSLHTFDLSSGTIVSNPTGTAKIESVGNGWYRCSVARAATTSTAQFALYLTTTGTTISYTGDGYSGIYIWGAQLEAGAFASPYTPTVASQVTRVADSAVMTGVNFSSWFNPSEGTLFADFVAPVDAVSRNRVFSLTDSTGNQAIDWITSAAGQATFEVFSVSTQAQLNCGAFSTTVFNKVAGSYKINDFAAVLNGGTVQTDTSGIVPSGIDRVGLGVVASTPTGATALNGYIRRLTYYPQALTSANLQAITR